MIKPQSITLKHAYEPVCAIERVLYLNADRNGYVMPYAPNLTTGEWYHLMTFDHEHYEVCVVARGFKSVSACRKALEFILCQSKKDFRIGGITEMVSEETYKNRNMVSTNVIINEFPE